VQLIVVIFGAGTDLQGFAMFIRILLTGVNLSERGHDQVSQDKADKHPPKHIGVSDHDHARSLDTGQKLGQV
jgi:hypothetical protein